jgi:hypothetical protein
MRKLIGLGIACLILGILVGNYVSQTAHHSPGVTRENFGILRPGMGEKEVEDVLGRPGEYLFRETGNYYREWTSARVVISLQFDEMRGHRLNGKWYGLLISGQLCEVDAHRIEHLRQPARDLVDHIRSLARWACPNCLI